MSVVITVPQQYGYVLLAAAVMAFSIILIGFAFPGAARNSIFTEEYMKQNFGAQHQSTFGEQIKKGGSPDMGNGYYSKNLSYSQWYKFNNAQRVHYNYLEWIASCITFLLIAGLYFPILSASLGLGVVVARIIYSFGYSAKGPHGRLIGALLNDAVVLALFIISIISSVYWLKGQKIA